MRTFENQYQLDPAIQTPEKQPESIQVMRKVKVTVLRGQICLYEFFSDFDKLRSGIILTEFFRTELSNTKIELTGPELDTLEQSFRVSPEDRRIKYLEFVHVVDDAFGAPQYMEKMSQLVTQPASLRALIPVRSPDLAEHTVELVQKTMDQIITYQMKRRPLTKAFFQSFDLMNNGQMTGPQFRSTVFGQSGGSALSDEMLQALSAYYTDPLTKAVRYQDFLDDIEDRIRPLEKAS
ncbi:MAG: hypothetical protein EZS28_008427 [Streblomastix strix]|uniref:EF-hand domain-containing protein n=1 Tax=Streblomastix strix TaxID=222440 RepID=A0A5J4WMI0_9EUKA|nr:MAG: hypothetical protein EZS28_008427 [Streblomastix strix]